MFLTTNLAVAVKIFIKEFMNNSTLHTTWSDEGDDGKQASRQAGRQEVGKQKYNYEGREWDKALMKQQRIR